MTKLLLRYDQVHLFPNRFDGESRNHVSTRTPLHDRLFHVPIMPANMKCTINSIHASELSRNGYFYVMHRFGDTYGFTKNANVYGWDVISISVGVKQADKDLIKQMHDEKLKIHFITIDIAHGHSYLCRDMIAYVKKLFPQTCVIAGNVCTRHGALELQDWGADVVKVGIAQGGACTTYGKTGFGMPMFSCVLDVCEYRHKSRNVEIPVIADGGIKTNGDIAKALVAGASWVMAGSIFAALSDSPAETIYLCDPPSKIPFKKKYFGSASAENGNTVHIEGTEVHLPYVKRTYLEKLVEIKHDLQSSTTYAGSVNLEAFKDVEWGYST